MAFGDPEAGTIEPFYPSGPRAPVEPRMLGCSGACRRIRRPIQAIEPVG